MSINIYSLVFHGLLKECRSADAHTYLCIYIVKKNFLRILNLLSVQFRSKIQWVVHGNLSILSPWLCLELFLSWTWFLVCSAGEYWVLACLLTNWEWCKKKIKTCVIGQSWCWSNCVRPNSPAIDGHILNVLWIPKRFFFVFLQILMKFSVVVFMYVYNNFTKSDKRQKVIIYNTFNGQSGH